MSNTEKRFPHSRSSPRPFTAGYIGARNLRTRGYREAIIARHGVRSYARKKIPLRFVIGGPDLESSRRLYNSISDPSNFQFPVAEKDAYRDS